MNLTTLLMINNLKQQQINEQSNKNQQQLAICKDELAASAKGLNCQLNCELCSKSFPNDYQLKVHLFYSHKIPLAKDDSRAQDKIEQQIDRNNNSNEETANVPKEMTNETSAGGVLDLTQQQNEELIKFEQMFKELQKHSENEEILKKFVLLQNQQQQLTNAAQKVSEESSPFYCDCCDSEFKSRSAFRNHNCPANENNNNRLADSPNSMFSNLSAQMANTVLNNSNNSTLNYALNGDAESLVNQTGNANSLNISSNGRDSLDNPLMNSSNQANSSQNNPILANLTQGLPQNLPSDVTNSIFFSSTAGITLDPNNKQPKFVTGRNYCNLCNKELCNKVSKCLFKKFSFKMCFRTFVF